MGRFRVQVQEDKSGVSPTWHHFGGKHEWSKPRDEAQRRAGVLENHFKR